VTLNVLFDTLNDLWEISVSGRALRQYQDAYLVQRLYLSVEAASSIHFQGHERERLLVSTLSHYVYALREYVPVSPGTTISVASTKEIKGC